MNSKSSKPTEIEVMLNGEGKFEEKEMKFTILEKSSKIKRIKKIDWNKKEEKS